ncbi:MAG: hypothetical protein FJ026_09690 [Chloroflexi bacterium]|nr:hypothetical protein [Chloroflexota bacterium]
MVWPAIALLAGTTLLNHAGQQSGANAMSEAAGNEARSQAAMAERRAQILNRALGSIGAPAIDAAGRAEADQNARTSSNVADRYGKSGRVGRDLAGRIGQRAKRSGQRRAQADAIGHGRSRIAGRVARLGSDLALQDALSRLSGAASQGEIAAASHSGAELRLLGQLGQIGAQAWLMHSANAPAGGGGGSAGGINYGSQPATGFTP